MTIMKLYKCCNCENPRDIPKCAFKVQIGVKETLKLLYDSEQSGFTYNAQCVQIHQKTKPSAQSACYFIELKYLVQFNYAFNI